jgi:sn-glycerol 3-phosphate transport system ATP-binding protein
VAEISFENVKKSYGKNEVVHGVDLDVARGEFLVILGPSGCGKSTLLRMVAGLEDISSGDIRIEGKTVNALEPRERGCAMVFQNYALYPHMSVAENIGYALRVAGLRKAERQQKVQSVAKALGLEEFLNRKPGQLSGGQRQRVAMGRAMIREPKVFLYDEPLSNLDARLRVAMRVEIRKLHQRLGTTTLFVTHDQVEAMTLADRIVVMNRGTIEQVAAPWEIYARPASTYVAGFVGSPGMNLLNVRVESSKGVVELSHGQTLPYDRKRWPGLPTGPVIAGFRAEQATLKPKGPSITAEYRFSEELGASRLIHAALGEETIVVASDNLGRLQAGQPLTIGVHPSTLQFFDADHGRRMAFEHVETGDGGGAHDMKMLKSA